MTQLGKSVSLFGLGLLVAAMAVVGTTGCVTDQKNRDATVQPPATNVLLHVGDTVDVIFSDTGKELSPFHDKIKEDGSITLHLNQKFIAAGKTALELQNDIHDRYVPDYYVRMTVTVITGDQYYTVNGQVRNPSQYKYVGPITVTRAIATAGGFTDFARRTGVIVIRANGTKEKVNCKKAIENPDLDLTVYPGDLIQVDRRGPFG